MEQRKNTRNINNIFYGVLGIATLVIATAGATFAYYTATNENTATIKGNMATVGIEVAVEKMTDIDEEKGGIIPMSNNMMQQALVSGGGGDNICVDNNGNAVCQVYKITVTNNSTSSMFVDGYVTLTGGSGIPEDIGPKGKNLFQTSALTGKTTMRWAQAFCEDGNNTYNKVSECSTGGSSTVRSSSTVNINALGGSEVKGDGFNKDEILTARNGTGGVTGTTTINGSSYEVINTNYIRISEHTTVTNPTTTTPSYQRENDTTSALVYNQYLEAKNNTADNTGDSTSTYTDVQVYYIVLWLSENGHNQTAEQNGNPDAEDFFTGNVTFITAQGNEVTATFAGHTRVDADTPGTIG